MTGHCNIGSVILLVDLTETPFTNHSNFATLTYPAGGVRLLTTKATVEQGATYPSSEAVQA